MARRKNPQVENVRMGPLAFFTLIATISLAVLAVLAVSSANATLGLSQRRATATSQLYLDETAAQVFVGTLQEGLAEGTSAEAALQRAAEAALEHTTAQRVTLACDLDVRYDHRGDNITASFDCGNGRKLEIALHLQEDGVLSVQTWRMTTVQNDEPAMGNLLGSSGM